MLPEVANKRSSQRQQSVLVRQLRRQLRQARQLVAKYKSEVRTAKQQERRQMSNVDQIVQASSEYLSGPALEFFAGQLRCSGKRLRGRRWTAEDKMLALSIFHRSAAAYRFLCTYFSLPSVRSLRRWLQGMRFEPGFCDRVFEILRAKTLHMSYVDKLCVLCVDEMAVKRALEFDRKRDIVDGF